MVPFCDVSGMAKASPDFFHISLPFACQEESVSSPRYCYKNSERGGEQFVILQRTLSGKGSFLWEGREFAVPPGHAFLAIVPEESSYFFPPDQRIPWKFSWLNFYGSLATSLCRELRRKFGPVLPLPPRTPAGSAHDALVRQGARRATTDPQATSLACYAFLLEWARQLDRPEKADPVETAMRICRVRFREPIGVKELAGETGLSREHFTRLFTGKIGLSPARFLRDLRAEAAERMMRGGAVSIREAALRCGFASPRALNRALSGRKSSSRSARRANNMAHGIGM